MRFIFKTDYEDDIRLFPHSGYVVSYGVLLTLLIGAAASTWMQTTANPASAAPFTMIGFIGGALEAAFRLEAEGDLHGTQNLLAWPGAVLDALPDALWRQGRSGKDAVDNVAFAQQRQQDVFGFDGAAAEPDRLLA